MSIKKFYPNASISLEVAPFCDGLCKITASIEDDGKVSKLDILSELTPAAVDAGNQRAVSQLLALLGTDVETPVAPEDKPAETSAAEDKPKLVKHRAKKSQPKEEPVEEAAETVPAVEAESFKETAPAPDEQVAAEETAAVEPDAAATEPAEESVAESAEDASTPDETVASKEDDGVDAGEPEEAAEETVPEEAAEEPEEDIEAKREWAKTVLVEIGEGARISAGMKSFVGKPVWDMVKEKRSFGPLILSRAKDGAHILTPDAEEALRIIVDMLKE